MKHLLSFVAAALAALSQVDAHGHHERSMHPREIASRQLEANRRHVVARNCAAEIAAFQQKRKLAKRSLSKRQLTGTTSALEPHETTIKNDTCVTAPEVTEGPYYINNDLIRQDLRESQGGILFELDIGIIDTSTCQPLPNVLVEIWHANATGHYSGFTTASMTGTGGGGNGTAPGGNNTAVGGGGGNMTMSFDPSASASGSGVAPSAVPSGSGNFTGGTGGGGGSASKTDDTNFLRGGWPTNDEGIVTFNTMYPGFYTGRTVHIHIMVHQNITYNSNGTYTSRSGSLVHIGQMFFDDDLNNEVMATSPYNTTSMTRQYNDEDSILAQENSNGYNAYVDASLIGADITDGVLGFITVGVDGTASYTISSYNYYASGEPYEAVSYTSTADVQAVSSSSTTTYGVTTTTKSQVTTEASSTATTSTSLSTVVSGNRSTGTPVHTSSSAPGQQQPGDGQGGGQGGGQGNGQGNGRGSQQGQGSPQPGQGNQGGRGQGH